MNFAHNEPFITLFFYGLFMGLSLVGNLDTLVSRNSCSKDS